MLPKVLLATLILFIGGCAARRVERPVSFQTQIVQHFENDENIELLLQQFEAFQSRKASRASEQSMKAQEAQIEKQFTNPRTVEVGTSPVRGNKSARIEVVLFGDYECIFSKLASARLKTLLERFPLDLKIVHKDLPLRTHPLARRAARAARAAGEQGKFWEMHDAIYSDLETSPRRKYLDIAREIGVDEVKFKKDLAHFKAHFDRLIDKDLIQAQSLGVRGTPAVLVNGVLIRGLQTEANYEKIIQKWIDRLAKQ